MHFIADLHTHTVASGHGFSTLQEMAQSASVKGIHYLAMTEHGPLLPGGPHLYYFYNLRVIPEIMYGVHMLKGVEGNIVDKAGNLDLPWRLLASLDIVWAGFHLYQEPLWTKAENTQAALCALRHPLIDGIVHPGNPEFPMDHQAVLQEAKQQGKLVELNNASLLCRSGCRPYCLNIAKLAKTLGVQLMVNSDAHIAVDVGRHDRLADLIAEAGLTEQDIINTSQERVVAFLERRKNEKLMWRQRNEKM